MLCAHTDTPAIRDHQAMMRRVEQQQKAVNGLDPRDLAARRDDRVRADQRAWTMARERRPLLPPLQFRCGGVGGCRMFDGCQPALLMAVINCAFVMSARPSMSMS